MERCCKRICKQLWIGTVRLQEKDQFHADADTQPCKAVKKMFSEWESLPHLGVGHKSEKPWETFWVDAIKTRYCPRMVESESEVYKKVINNM